MKCRHPLLSPTATKSPLSLHANTSTCVSTTHPHVCLQHIHTCVYNTSTCVSTTHPYVCLQHIHMCVYNTSTCVSTTHPYVCLQHIHMCVYNTSTCVSTTPRPCPVTNREMPIMRQLKQRNKIPIPQANPQHRRWFLDVVMLMFNIK